jgi:GAF domain-containing protein
MQRLDIGRYRGTLRRRMIVSLAFVALLITVSVAFFSWQLVTLREAIRDLRVQDDRLTLALDTVRHENRMLLVIQDKTSEHIPAIFVEEVGASIRAVEARKDRLNEQMALLPEGDRMRERIKSTTDSLQSMTNIAEGTVRHVEDGNWPAAEIRAALLLERRGDTDWQLYRLVSLARDRRTKAEARANEAMRSMSWVSAPLMVIAVLIASLTVFATTRSIAVGVEQLSHSAHRLAEGHFEERTSVVRQDELGVLARSFNTMANELQDLYARLEQQIAERTADLARRNTQLEAAAQVAREAAAIRTVDRLLDVTVHLISDHFGFYHAGIFLLDVPKEYAVLQAASSEGGQRMLARGHKLKIGQVGIVGYAAGTGQPRIALDVGTDAVFFNNPDLPNTRSELSLPLKIRGQVIGILDVQSIQEAAFSDEDVAVLQAMADQVALAIENARLLDESQRALRELETLYGQQLREAWQERAARQPAAYHYTGVDVEAVDPSSIPETGTARTLVMGPQAHRRPAVVHQADGRRLNAPIRLRGQTLGEIILRQDPEDESWSDEEVALVEELSTQIGLALENARLLEETRERAEREQMISRMTTHFTRSLDMKTLLQTAVHELGQLPHVAEVSVHVGSPEAPSQADQSEESASEEILL